MTVQPRWLKPADAAAYICEPVKRLRELVESGLLPRPIYHFGEKSPRYDREAIDALIEGRRPPIDMDAIIQRMTADGAFLNRHDRRKHQLEQTRKRKLTSDEMAAKRKIVSDEMAVKRNEKARQRKNK
jgi:hypothetical protein